MKKLLFLLTFLGVVLYCFTAFSINLPYKLELRSQFPGIKFFNKTDPHIYKAQLLFYKDILPYVYYSQKGTEFELGLGAKVDYSLDNHLYRNAIFKTGIYLKKNLKPISIKYYILPDNQYIATILDDNYGLSLLSENYKGLDDDTAKNNRLTLSGFGSLNMSNRM